MNDSRRQLFPDQNPFSTAAVRPGAIEYQFDDDISAAALVSRLQENQWRGEIVGPHGSGKSTLLRTLFPLIEAAGRQVHHHVVKPTAPQLSVSSVEQATWTDTTQIVVEGYELLGRRRQRELDRACRAKQAGLLITCHQPQGFPALFHTSITVELATGLVEHLLPPGCALIQPDDVRDGFSRHGQNLRELLFEMYDLYELRRGR